MKISTVIITKNEATNIERCLKSLSGVADEIIIVDAYSQDATREICEKFSEVRFYSKSWGGYAASKNYGNGLAVYNYILSIDADEVLSEALRLELLQLKPRLIGEAAFEMPRLNHVGEAEIKHCGWYPDFKVRLFPKKSAMWVGDFVHEQLYFFGKIERLKNDLLHFTYHSEAQFESKMTQYAKLAAEEAFKKGKRCILGVALLKAGFKFFNIYFIKLGFLDGNNGGLIARQMSKNILLKYFVLKQLRKKPSAISVLDKFLSELVFHRQVLEVR